MADLAEDPFVEANDDVLRRITEALRVDSRADLGITLHKLSQNYSRVRKVAESRAERRKLEGQVVVHSRALASPTERPSSARLAFARASDPATVLWPFSAQICSLLGVSSYLTTSPPSFPSFPQILNCGRTIWENTARAVIQLCDGILVKVGQLERDEPVLLDFISSHAPGIPIPKPLGFMKIGKISYMFMTVIPGAPLEERWSFLSQDQKISISNQLNEMLVELRRIEFPPGTPLGSWFRSLLRDDHRIVLTHGDFHPRNIMIVEEGDEVRVSGIIDWEMGGWYPEHWETIKTFNTRGCDEDCDFWDYLPDAIAGYTHELTVDFIMDHFISIW
ncbi:kinase-like domain-containing protein [Sparassis latifolia]